MIKYSLVSLVALLSTVSIVQASCQAISVDAHDPQAYLPDQTCTPGVVDPLVIQDTVSSTICVKGYTKTIRPPTSYTTKLKRQQIIEYGYADTNLSSYEEDHFISLELGGSPRDPKNLWPEPHGSWNEKDEVEGYLHEQICSGQMTLGEAQEAITHNWYNLYLHLHPLPPSAIFRAFIQKLFFAVKERWSQFSRAVYPKGMAGLRSADTQRACLGAPRSMYGPSTISHGLRLPESSTPRSPLAV